VLRRLPTGSRSVGLTFDDGPTPETTPRLLEILARANATATFFLSGRRVAMHPDLVAAVVAGGHAVYGHGWEHVDLADDPARAVADMRTVEEALSRHRPTPSPYLVRLPYNAGYNLAKIHRAMAAFHPDVQFAWWSLSTRDYAIPEKCRTRDDLIRECRAAAQAIKVPALEGAIVLLHEQPYEIPSPFNAEVAALLLPMVLDAVQRCGLRAVKLSPAHRPSVLREWVLIPAT
jgi:peptidoglycan/xylan/chitin deacetylase (PgdA/CDA1 family)